MTDTSTSKITYHTIGFYNLENLFDTENDPNILDDDFTENSERNWNKDRYCKKIEQLGSVISNIGYKETLKPPVIIGVAEVENNEVLIDLVASKQLKNKGYSFVHFDSPDERGIDTALLYRESYFTILSSEAIPLYINGKYGNRDYTRDILYVKGKLENEMVHLLINHWPSRRSGVDDNSYKRIAAANKNNEIIEGIISEDPNAKIIVLGDFNDDPKSESVKILSKKNMYNPMEMLLTYYSGSLNYKGRWNLFDQIIISNNFLQQHGNLFRFEKAEIFDPQYLKESKGKYKGNPFRTFIGKKYLGGFSDHFPVYVKFTLKKNIN